MADGPETIRTVRDQFMGTLRELLAAAEKHARTDGKDDAERALAYAQAAGALMSNDLGKQLVIGREGLVAK